MPQLAFPEPPVSEALRTLTPAIVAPQYSETPSIAEIQAAYDALPERASGDRIHYTTPAGIVLAYEVIGTSVVMETTGIQEYPAVPNAENFAPNTPITVRVGTLVTAYTNNAGSTAFIKGDFEGAGAGGGTVSSALDFIRKVFTATAGQQDYALDSAPTDIDSIQVRVAGGQVLLQGSDFTVAGQVVSLSADNAALIQAGKLVQIIYV